MDSKSPTSGASPERLAELLGKSLDVDGEEEGSMEQRKADYLRFRLEGALPLQAADAEALSRLLTQACRELLPLEGRTLGSAILDEELPLDAAKAVKEYGKKLASRKDREVQHDVAVAVYYAAVANALLFRDTRITSFPYHDLAGAFAGLREKRWMDPRLARLFAKAERACRKKVK